MSCIISLYLLNTIMASAESNMLDMESGKGEEEGEDGGRGRRAGEERGGEGEGRMVMIFLLLFLLNQFTCPLCI